MSRADELQQIELDHLARRTYTRLVAFLHRRLGNEDDAAELAQESFARLTAAGLKGVREPDKFLFRTALNLVTDHGRQQRSAIRSAGPLPEDFSSAAALPSAEQVLSGKQACAVLQRAIDELPPDCAAALVLYRFDEISHAAIADRLGISVSMVEKHVRHALDHCRMRLAEAHGEEVTPPQRRKRGVWDRT